MAGRLGVGFIGSGFMTRFHIRSWEAVRDADIRGIYSPTRANAEDAAALARSLRVGDAKAFDSIEAMVADPSIDCVWLCGPNFARVDNMERIVAAIKKGARLTGVACEKPLGRNAAEAARMVELVEEAGVLHGYLENQLFSPNLERGKQIIWARGAAAAGRPYLARAAEEHGGPHMPWFWQGDLQGGGVLNDMMCHSLEVGRYLLTKPGAPRDSIRPVKVSAQIASLKWSRPDYVKQLRGTMTAKVDYGKHPAEDWARACVTYVDDAGTPLIVEATTSWSFVGAGLRLSMELLGPEYSMSVSTLDGGTKVFFSRHLQEQQAGEDLIEKQNAEQGLMPIVGNEAAEYGYENENRAFTRSFLDGVQPELNFHAGRDVTELLMACYMSAEEERVIEWKPANLKSYVPPRPGDSQRYNPPMTLRIAAIAFMLLGSVGNAQMPMLTAAEKADGWKLMFDGKSLAGWRGYKDEKAPGGWRAFDGELVRLGGGGDLMTVEQYSDFEMRFEWKITEYGNSGVIYRIATTEPYPWHTGPEYQVLDNGHHPDGKNAITSAGSNYAVDPPVKDVTKPVGQWNEGRIIVKGNHVEHWLNGVKVVEYEFGSADWQKHVQASKFGKIPPYGTAKRGYIALQDHESVVMYRNLKIKTL